MLKTLFAAGLVCGAIAVAGVAPASAMPLDNLATKVTGNVDNVHWGCRWRCWRGPVIYRSYGYVRPAYRAYAFAPRRVFIGPRYGFHRGFRHW